MLLRFSLSAAGALLLAAGAQAQSNASFLPVPGVKNAGTYNMATGKLVKGDAVTKGPLEVLYANNCAVGVYSNGITANGIPSRYHDAGGLPSDGSPYIPQPGTAGADDYLNITSFAGTADSYTVNQFNFSYCTQTLPVLFWEIDFYDSYVECADISTTPPTPAAAYVIPNLPGTQTPGTTACWTITVNLFNSTFAFPIAADGEGTWDNSNPLDTFGFAVGLYNGDPTNIWTSPILEGDPEGILGDGPGGTGCAVGVTTVFWAGSFWAGTASQGSGYKAWDRFGKSEWQGGAGPWVHNGCYWFGGYNNSKPMGNVHFVIWGDADVTPDDPGVQYGGGDANFPCPCGNNNDGSLLPDLAGCAGTTNTGGCRLVGAGVASVSNDTVVLYADNAKTNTNGLFFKGDSVLLPGVPLGGANANGLLQLTGSIKRFGALAVTNGMADSSSYAKTLSDLSNATAGDTRHYQFWYRTPKKSGPCTNPSPGGSNSSNGYSVVWGA